MEAKTSFLNNEFPALLNTLTDDHQPIWGKMSAQHMIEHLTTVFNISNGTVDVPVLPTPEQVAKAKRHTFIYKNPFPKSLRTPFLPENPSPLNNESLKDAKEELTSNIAKFFAHFKDNEDMPVNHPILGPLNFEEWNFFHIKHVSHHFCQFGLLEKEITD